MVDERIVDGAREKHDASSMYPWKKGEGPFASLEVSVPGIFDKISEALEGVVSSKIKRGPTRILVFT